MGNITSIVVYPRNGSIGDIERARKMTTKVM